MDASRAAPLSCALGISDTVHMIDVRDRGRIATLALTAVVGCRGTDTSPAASRPAAAATSADTMTAAMASASTMASAGGPAPLHSAPWVVPPGEPEAVKPGSASCLRGAFCMARRAEPGATTASAPYQDCYASYPAPRGVGPPTLPNVPLPLGAFDRARTAAQRAADPAACCYRWLQGCHGDQEP
jgi:hypothetical protein